MSSFKLLSTPEYFEQLIKAVRGASRSINITALDVMYDSKTKELLDEVEIAAKRGVKVTMSGDTLTFNEIRKKPLGPINVNHHSSQATRDFAERIRQAGGRFEWLGKTFLLVPYKGRNHEKWSVVDNHVFTFGGVNLYKAGLESTDYMLHTENSTLADQLRDIHDMIIKESIYYKGEAHAIDTCSSYTIDSIIPFSSEIYERARILAAQSASVVFVSQFYPTGPLASALKRTKTTYYMNRPEQMSSLGKYMLIFDRFRARIKNSYKRDKYLHSKFILFTLKDGTKTVLTGSHNFSYAGVKFGTIEIVLESKDTSVIKQIEKFIESEIV